MWWVISQLNNIFQMHSQKHLCVLLHWPVRCWFMSAFRTGNSFSTNFKQSQLDLGHTKNMGSVTYRVFQFKVANQHGMCIYFKLKSKQSDEIGPKKCINVHWFKLNMSTWKLKFLKLSDALRRKNTTSAIWSAKWQHSSIYLKKIGFHGKHNTHTHTHTHCIWIFHQRTWWNKCAKIAERNEWMEKNNKIMLFRISKHKSIHKKT